MFLCVLKVVVVFMISICFWRFNYNTIMQHLTTVLLHHFAVLLDTSRFCALFQVVVVLNFDCPFNTADYLHRAGRTGRARELYPGEGEVVTYITQNKEVLFARKIQVGWVFYQKTFDFSFLWQSRSINACTIKMFHLYISPFFGSYAQ